MLTGLLARRWCKSPKVFVYDKFAERKPGFDKGQGLLILHDSTPPYYPLYTTEGIKAPFINKVTGLAHQAWSPHVILFFFFSLFLSLFFFQDDYLEHRGSLSSLVCLGFWDPIGKVLCVFTVERVSCVLTPLRGCLRLPWTEQVLYEELYCLFV